MRQNPPPTLPITSFFFNVFFLFSVRLEAGNPRRNADRNLRLVWRLR